MEASSSFSISEALKFGWAKTKENLWNIILIQVSYFVSFFIFYFAIFFVFINPNSAVLSTGDFLILVLSSLASFFLILWVNLGFISMWLKVIDVQPVSFADIFSQGAKVLNMLAASLIYAVIVWAGMILLFVPGVIWSVKYMLFPYFIVDRGMGPVAAIKASGKATAGEKWNLFVLSFAISLVASLGALFFGIGILVTLPIGAIAMTYVYRKLAVKVA